jgi:hypothetical protein
MESCSSTTESQARGPGDVELGATERAPYSIVGGEGQIVRRLQDDDTPEAVSLRAGSYVVRGTLSGSSPVEVTVRIVQGRTTTVYLDGSVRASSQRPGVAAVYAVDGSFVGFRAN